MGTGTHSKFPQGGNIVSISSGRNAPSLPFVCFTLAASRYALPLTAVERVVPVVELTPLPRAPEIVLGIVNLAGRIIPVVNIRKRLGHPDREIQLSDHLIVARTSRRPVALLVDRAEGLVERADHEIARAASVLPGLEYVRGVAKLGDGLILIHDLDTFLSLDEERKLGEALARTGT
jgi:purine-binding chemotaxis protein CheW